MILFHDLFTWIIVPGEPISSLALAALIILYPIGTIPYIFRVGYSMAFVLHWPITSLAVSSIKPFEKFVFEPIEELD